MLDFKQTNWSYRILRKLIFVYYYRRYFSRDSIPLFCFKKIIDGAFPYLVVLSIFLVSWNISEEIGDSNQVRHVISEWVMGSPGALPVLKTAPSFIAYWLSGFAYQLYAPWMKYLLLLNAYQLFRRARLRE